MERSSARQWVLSAAAIASNTQGTSVEAIALALDGMGVREAGRLDLRGASSCLELVNANLARANAYAWAHAIAYARRGARAGLLDGGAAWSLAFTAARAVQDTFTSWESFGDAYAFELEGISDGRAGCRERVAQLLNDPASAWRVTPWQTDLGDEG